MNQQQRIKSFVQHTLGCTCPDKVFEHIEDRRAKASESPHTRSFAIGGRLLIYIWRVKDTVKFAENLSAMLAAGKKERDETGLNRFRAVVASDDPQHVGPLAELVFSGFSDRDDRLHLHVISADTLKNV